MEEEEDDDDDNHSNYDNCSCTGSDLKDHATNIHELDLRTIIDNARYGNEITEIQAATNRVLDILEGETILPFCNTQFEKFKSLYHVTKGRQSELTAFYRNLQQHTCSRTYTNDVRRLMKCDGALNDGHAHASHRLFAELRSIFVQRQISQRTDSTTPEATTCVASTSAAGRGTVRYVGGYCVAKIRHRNTCALRRLASSTVPAQRATVRQAQYKLNLLDTIIRSQSQITAHTTDDASVAVTSHRQNLRSSLVHITDPAMCFFQHLTSTVQTTQTMHALNTHVADMYTVSMRQVVSNMDLFEEFYSLFTPELVYTENTDKYIYDLYGDVAKLFVATMTNQLRRKFISDVKVVKQTALRKKVCRKRSHAKEPKNTKRHRRIQTSELCKCCCQPGSEGDEWIQCGVCNSWYHRHCAEIADDQEWQLLQRPQAEFRCHLC